MKRKRDMVCVTFTPQELRVLLEGIMWFRNKVISNGGPTEDIDEILLRIIK